MYSGPTPGYEKILCTAEKSETLLFEKIKPLFLALAKLLDIFCIYRWKCKRKVSLLYNWNWLISNLRYDLQRKCICEEGNIIVVSEEVFHMGLQVKI